MAVTFAPRVAPRVAPDSSQWVPTRSPGVLVDPHGFLGGAGSGSAPRPPAGARPARPVGRRADGIAGPVAGPVHGVRDRGPFGDHAAGSLAGPEDEPVDDLVGSPRRAATWAAAGVAVLMAVSGVLGAIGSVSADATPSPRVWVVREGDTLWGIARTLQPRGDVRPLVSRLVQLNGTTAVHVGDSIVVPSAHR